ncbi:MAG: hypothetical protein QMD46_09635 [Methanomicrobiales archaeon]|nr:hypothetical protein [Methanomicrobiales archaeon]MDI6877218.1 hypothetical protein [Methanomicrobiales archaeon]
MVAMDALGYAFMSVSTLVAAPVFVGGGLLRWTRRALIANGLLAFLYPILLAIGILWIATLLLSALLLTMVFNTARAG